MNKENEIKSSSMVGSDTIPNKVKNTVAFNFCVMRCLVFALDNYISKRQTHENL